MQPVFLDNPACDVNCAPCAMICAMLPSRLDWWAREIIETEELLALSPSSELRGRLDTARAAHARLVLKYEESPRSASAMSKLHQARC